MYMKLNSGYYFTRRERERERRGCSVIVPVYRERGKGREGELLIEIQCVRVSMFT